MAELALSRPAGDATQGGVNLLRVAIRAVTRHWWQILGIWVLATGGLAYLINANVRPMYEAVSLLRVEPNRRDLFGTGAAESFEPYLETQRELITSPNVLATALSDPKMNALKIISEATDPEQELRRRLLVLLVPKSYLIRVAMTSPSADESAKAVNAVVDAYLKTAAEYTQGTNALQLKNLENYQRELQGQFDEKKEGLLILAGKSNVEMQAVDPLLAQQGAVGSGLPIPTRNRVTMDEYKRVRDELFKIQMGLIEAEAILTMRETAAQSAAGPGEGEAEPPVDVRMDQALLSDPDVAAVVQQIDAAERKHENASRLARSPNDPARLKAKRDLKKLSDRYNDLIDSKRKQYAAGFTGEGGVKLPDGSLAQARENVQKLKAQKEVYEKILTQTEVTNRQEGSDVVKIALVKEEMASLKQLQDKVVARLEQLRFESRGEARISQINVARASSIPVSDKRTQYMLFTPAGVLAVLLGLFVLLELKIGRVCDIDDLSRQSSVEVFAVPPLPGPRIEPGQRGAREREARLQEFLQTLDHLRVALCGDEPPSGVGRCLLVTSATAGEGKTTLTAQLAACCAKAGVSTLVIDGDLRRATLSRILNEEATPGLSDVLEGDLDPEAATVALPDAGFHFLAAGSPGRDPSWLLKNQRIGQLLTRYRQIFDLIIIDTPPLLPVPDALTIGRWTDGVVLTTRFDVSRFPLVDRARKRLSSAGIPLLKTVVNGVRSSRFNYGTGGGYGYGYGGGYGYSGRNGYGEPDQIADSPAAPTA